MQRFHYLLPPKLIMEQLTHAASPLESQTQLQWRTPRNGSNEILAAVKVPLKLTYSYSGLYRGWMFLNGEGTQFIKWRVENKKNVE